MATVSLPDEPAPRRGWSRALLYALALVAVTFLLLPFRDQLDKAHVTLAYLLVVLVAAANGGRRVGLPAAAIAFLAFNWFFLRPYGTLTIADPLDWFVLVTFLATSVVASQLFHRAQLEADEARERTREVSALATTGAEALRVARAGAALQALAEGVCRTLGVTSSAIFVTRDEPADGSLQPGGQVGELPASALDAARMVVEQHAGLAVLPDGVSRLFPLTLADAVHPMDGTPVTRLIVPITARGATVGALCVGHAAPFALGPERRRLLSALLYYVALGADRLRLERAEEQVEALREADRLKNAVLASVSHDLRTPLTTITALAHEMAVLGDERADIIAQEAARLNRFVRDLLDVARLTGGAMPVRPEVVPADELVSGALQQVEGAFGGREIRVSLDPADPLMLGRVDPVQSVRILVNLLENAHKYAPPATAIDLAVRRDGAFLEFSVADRGPGISPDEVSRIFEPLYRPRVAPPDAGSAGLGLAIARGFAEAQGGSLTFAQRDGGGSVFTARLPSADIP